MRIISGELRGKKILEPDDRITRPLRDLVKESIFNIIKHSKKISVNLENSNILDLFSGVGSFGLLQAVIKKIELNNKKIFITVFTIIDKVFQFSKSYSKSFTLNLNRKDE